MKHRKAVIIDDESMAISALKHEIELFVPNIQVIGSGQTVAEGVQLIETLKPEIVFLDIRLNAGLSFELLENLKHHQFHLIFTTAYSNYAIEAIKKEAFDYLLKPVSGADILKSLERLSAKEEAEKPAKPRFEISEAGSKTFVDFDDIIYFQSVGNYCKIYTQNKKVKIIATTLKNAEAQCNHHFVRCHKSYLVNKSHIAIFNSGSLELVLSDGAKIRVSNRRRSFVNQQL